MDAENLGLLARHPEIPRRLLTAEEFLRMAEAGILTEGDRVELIEGEPVAMTPSGSEHAGTVGALNRLPVMAIGDRGIVFPQNPVRLDRSCVPQPDFTILKPRPDGYRSAMPGPDDVLHAIEVADSSLPYDRGPKLALYAARSIRELWIVDLVHRMIEVHRTPRGRHYASSTTVERTATLRIEALPGVALAASDILG
jgi:Uma2 family endonuclease